MQNEAKNEAKTDLNEAKLEAKKSKNSAICAKRSEDPQWKEAGFNEPQGGYMERDLSSAPNPKSLSFDALRAMALHWN